MNFPQFWAKATYKNFEAWGWSSENVAEAQQSGMAAAQRVAARILSGQRPPPHWAYYPTRPFREQILEERKNDRGETSAVVTRNSYGCLVLNTARIMFVDIDLETKSTSNPSASSGFFGLFRKPKSKIIVGEQQALARVDNWTRHRPEWAWRVYRTRAGLRLLATHDLIDPSLPTTGQIFEELDADPLYRKLCQTQKCYRARLTPKPWRCGIRGKPVRWPWPNAKAEKVFQNWEGKYQAAATAWATCKFIDAFGTNSVHPEIAPILKLHDDATKQNSGLELA
jgi:hypothetical protein